MWPRKKIDIAWSDLAFAAWQCVAPAKPIDLPEPWGDETRTLACLSVRTGFDLLLQTLRLPAGSDVLMTGVTIPDMVRIVEEHQLNAVPVDLDFETLEPTVEAIESRITRRTRAIVIAHLFGAQIRMEPILELARRRNLLVIEDCAQAYCGAEFSGCSEADFSLFSFGPIKTATALGGALVRVRDSEHLATMRAAYRRYPVQRRAQFALRVVKYSILKLLSNRILFSVLTRGMRAIGMDADRAINSLARNFGGADLFARIRRQPSPPLLALMQRRLASDATRIRDRAALGASLAEGVRGHVELPGRHADQHTHWLFPIVCQRPDELAAALRAAGFDATRHHNLVALEESPLSAKPTVPVAKRLVEDIIILPMYPELTPIAADEMMRIVRRFSD